ncbi:uncharacterized protein LOC133743660 isoform X1 [Rosa rugosa]|uniref:uncharacterized protein LOC133743660 isoform X1 n=1 Tax=Rosa rugosa TaxID=74645 RepID=UPI002B400B19|nr:uncharacterized protein LOC133743660 isoform X1 [Rosa rugosa]
MALRFEVLGRFNRARAAQLTLPHFVCQTPLFMPVGTQGTIKGLATDQLEEIGCQIILGNTYHLALRPTSELIDEMGGLHKFMNWPRALLTDSGGFQMVSLLHLADITEKGVTFQSPVDGKPMLLTPEESIQIQNRIGADIIMALDDVVKTTITGPRIEEAMYRTLRWIDRCIAAHTRPSEQNLFGIVQGGLDPVLRDICVRGLVERNLPGYAIGGLAGGESKDSFWRVVTQCTAALPEDKPRYVMGVGYPLDIVVCSALGADMYDCVYPTRTARFGTALIPEGVLKLKHKAMANDTRPIDPTCACMVCKNYTRAYIHCLVTKDAMGSQLLSYHNLYYMLKLSRDLHSSIIQGTFPEFVCNFLQTMIKTDGKQKCRTQRSQLAKEEWKEEIHTKKRNRLEHKRLNALVYVKYNSLLRERNIKRNAKMLDPILVEEIDSDDEWISEVEDPVLPGDLSWLEEDLFEVDAIRNVPIECYEQGLSTRVPIHVEPLEEPILDDVPILDDDLGFDEHAAYSPSPKRKNDESSSKVRSKKKMRKLAALLRDEDHEIEDLTLPPHTDAALDIDDCDDIHVGVDGYDDYELEE